jgi:hypothetical protein
LPRPACLGRASTAANISTTPVATTRPLLRKLPAPLTQLLFPTLLSQRSYTTSSTNGARTATLEGLIGLSFLFIGAYILLGLQESTLYYTTLAVPL